MTLIVLDFDGTIADSLEIFIRATNRLASDFKYEPISPSHIPLLRRLSLREMIRELGLSSWKLPFFLRRFRQELHDLMTDCQLVDGMRDAIWHLNQHDYRLGVVTSNSHENVTHFLRRHDLDSSFEFVYGNQVLSGKTRVLQPLARQHSAEQRSVAFVGDEISDITAARQAGVVSIAVSWGFNERQVLLEQSPDILVDWPHQLLEAINQFSDKTTH